MHHIVSRHRQGGAVIVTVALTLLFLLGFMGIALDFGRLFIVKTELQTAMDSCALSAAQELDGASDAFTRASNAGIAAGNLNNVNLQSASWSSKGKIVPADVTFRNAAYAVTATPTAARYAQCQHTHPAVQMWLLKAMGAFSGDAATYPNTQNVAAMAVATRASTQTTCPIPVAVKPKAGGTAPNYGFVVGEWVTFVMKQNAAQGGQMGWANLDGSSSASETRNEMNGFCGTKVGDTLGTPGVQTSIAEPWNYRFGIYKKIPDFSVSPVFMRPDSSGYAYTSTNWMNTVAINGSFQNNAWDGTPDMTGSHATAANFKNKRLAFASCANTGTSVRGANSCESIINRSLNSFQDLAAPGNTTGGHKQYGSSRRLVLAPVVDGASRVIDYACMLMLQPLSIPMRDVQLEFIGNAGNINSPCTTNGLPGGSAGPLVPVLVR